jgi:predicted nucleic acid-binding protein
VRRVLVDTNVFLYALGAEHQLREPCRRLVSAMAKQEIAAEVTVEILQEVFHLRRRRGPAQDAAERVREIIAWGLPVHDFAREDFEAALRLLDHHPRLPARDAVHVATALNHGVEAILSADADFDVIEGFTRVDPADAEAVESLR